MLAEPHRWASQGYCTGSASKTPRARSHTGEHVTPLAHDRRRERGLPTQARGQESSSLGSPDCSAGALHVPSSSGWPRAAQVPAPPVCDSSPLRPPLLPPRFPFSCLPALSCLIASGAHVPGRRGSPALPNYNQRWLPPPGVGSNTPHGQEQSPSLAPQSLASPTGHWDSEEGFHPWTAASGLLRHSIISERAKLHNPP